MISLNLKLDEQRPNRLTFRLRVSNSGDERLLLPYPNLTGLEFTDRATGEHAEWYTSLLVSAGWAGITLAPGEHRDVSLLVCPCAVSEFPGADSLDSGDYARWCVDLHAGFYRVHYANTVDRDYFDGDSHWRFSELEREAALQSALPWLGSAQSNALEMQWPDL